MVDLITLDEYKLAKSITKGNDDQVLEQLITNVSAIIQKYLGRDIVNTGIIEEVFSFDYDTPYIYLDNYPIKNGSVVINPLTSSYYDSTVHLPYVSDTYVVDHAKGKLIRRGHCNWWPRGDDIIIIQYELDGDDETEVPGPLKQVTIDMVTYYHKQEWRDSQQLMGASINNQTGTGNTNTPSKSFPPHIQRILDLYK